MGREQARVQVEECASLIGGRCWRTRGRGTCASVCSAEGFVEVNRHAGRSERRSEQTSET